MEFNREFFARDAEVVARELLGKVLVRNLDEELLKTKIVETEAYYGEEDPASRACQNGDLRETMKMDAGTILIYGVHNSWLMNFVTGSEGEASAVLIRALEPLNFKGKCSGPGLLTRALQIDKRFHKQSIFDNKELIIVNDKNSEIIGNENNGKLKKVRGKEDCESINKGIKGFEIVETFRIGVKKDLPRKLRFYIKGNEYVSRK